MSGLARILVVEDDPGFAELLARWLGDLGAEIHTAATIHAAAAAIAPVAPQVIVLDLSLPDASALDAIPAMVRAAGPGVPIVVLTGRADVDRQAVRALGARELIQKRIAIDPETVRQAVLAAFVQEQDDAARREGPAA